MRRLYNNAMRSMPVPNPDPSHLIHFIWIQGVDHLKTASPVYYENLQLWKQMFPDWTVRVWDGAAARAQLEATDRELGLNLVGAYDEARKLAVKADIARYSILYTYGGLYVDADLECLRPFAHFLHPTKPTAMMRNLYDAIEKKHLCHTNNSIFYIPLVKSGVAKDMMVHMSATPLPQSTKAVLTYGGPKALFNVMSRYDMQWVPTDLFEPIQIHTMNMYGVRGDAARAAFPYACTVHTYGMSWVNGTGRRVLLALAKSASAIMQQRTVLLFVLFVLILVILPVCVVFVTLWAKQKRAQ